MTVWAVFSVKKICEDIQKLHLYKRILKLFIECYTSFVVDWVYIKIGNK